MGLYGRYVLPHLIDLAMRGDSTTTERRRFVPLARGRTVEIGFGSGLNLACYGPGTARLTAVDPSLELWKLARGRVARTPFTVAFTACSAERLALRSASFDTAVMTWTLCSIPDPLQALGEVRRVLSSGGQLVFVEHGRAPEERVRRWQDRLTPWWRPIAGGCELNRDILGLLRAAGFRIERLEEGYGDGPRPFSYLYRGVAQAAP